MNIKVDYFDHNLYLSKETINVIEIENKKYFYRFVNDLFSIYNNGYTDDISFFDDNEKEENMNNHINVFINFFDFEFDSKRIENNISRYVDKNIDDENKQILLSLYKRILKTYDKILNNIDLSLKVEREIKVDDLTKMIKIGINYKNELLDNLFLLIDLEKVLNTKNILIFINLKQYLTKSELIEFYKYSIYNGILIILVDSQCYGGTLDYEKKLIIDENLDEFMI